MTTRSPPRAHSHSHLAIITYSSSDREVKPTLFEPVMNKHWVKMPPDQYLPHDFVMFSRSALHNLNISSPHAMAS